MEENNKKYLDVLAKIDFNYWRGKNLYYSTDGLHPSTAIMLGMIHRKEIDGRCFLSNCDAPATSVDLVRTIKNKIKNFSFDKSDNDDLGDIFDLIQVWGGKMGKYPYFISKCRHTLSEWAEDYRRGAQTARDGNDVPAYATAIETWMKIKGLGPSFATKHLKFWADMPILDTRISLLLTGKKNPVKFRAARYKKFLCSLEELKKKAGLPKMSDKETLSEIEKALFAFSQAFFKNSKLEFLDKNNSNEKDYNIACKLMNL